MLPFPAPGGWLYPAKLSAALPKYRELLRTRSKSNSSGAEDSSSLFQQAKERVLLRLRERRATARIDPRRALSRLQDRVVAAKDSLRDIKNEQKERLRQYVATAVGGSSAAVLTGSSSFGAPAWEAAPTVVATESCALDAATAEAVMGSNGLLRHVVLAGVGGACKLFLAAGAHTSVTGQEHMEAALARQKGRGLITVSNHVGAIDDPLITSSIVPASKLLDPPAVRWTMCASDRCFKSAVLAPFFRAAKVLPVERGAGLGQFGMQLAQSRLLAGEWVHIFPEGTRSKDGRMLPVRKGVGWLVAATAAAGGEPPLVLPFVHSGMEKIMPKGSALPKLGQELRVMVGEPVSVEDLLAAAEQQGWSEHKLQVAIADRVGQVLYSLKAQLDGLPLEQVVPQSSAAALTISEDTLLPLIEEEMDSLAHRWQDRWQRLSLPSFTQRAREEAAMRRAALRSSVFGASESFEDIASATEEAAGMVSGWEHAGGTAAPRAASVATGGQADGSSLPSYGGAASQERAAGTAAAQGRTEQLALLVRQKLRLLRGSVFSTAAEASLHAADQIGAACDVSSSRPGAPLSRLRNPFASHADSRSRLQALLSTAADYSAARVQHMKELLSGQSAAAVPTLGAA